MSRVGLLTARGRRSVGTRGKSGVTFKDVGLLGLLLEGTTAVLAIVLTGVLFKALEMIPLEQVLGKVE